MKRRFRCPVQAKKEYVAEVLAGYRTEVVARRYGISPKTLREWVRQYQDKVDDLMVKKRDEAEKLKQDVAKLQEIIKKYEGSCIEQIWHFSMELADKSFRYLRQKLLFGKISGSDHDDGMLYLANIPYVAMARGTRLTTAFPDGLSGAS